MGVELTYTHDAFPKGEPFAINGIGLLPNGEKVVIADEVIEAFEQTQGISFDEFVANSSNLTKGGKAKDPAPPVDVVENAAPAANDKSNEGGDN